MFRNLHVDPLGRSQYRLFYYFFVCLLRNVILFLGHYLADLLAGDFVQVFAAPYSLRFPRIDRIRYDKPWHECLDVQCKRMKFIRYASQNSSFTHFTRIFLIYTLVAAFKDGVGS